MAPELIVRRQTWPGGAGTHTGHKASTGKKTPGGVGTHTGHKRARARTRGHTDHTDEPHSHPHDTPARPREYRYCTGISMRSSHTLVHSQLRARKMLIGQTSKHASKKVKRPSRGRESFPTFLLWRERSGSGSEHTHVVPSCAGRCAGTQTAELRAPTPSDHPRSSNKNIAYSSVSQHDTNYVPMFTRMCSHRNSLKNTTMSRLHKL